jgi:hypothetical protein
MIKKLLLMSHFKLPKKNFENKHKIDALRMLINTHIYWHSKVEF